MHSKRGSLLFVLFLELLALSSSRFSWFQKDKHCQERTKLTGEEFLNIWDP